MFAIRIWIVYAVKFMEFNISDNMQQQKFIFYKNHLTLLLHNIKGSLNISSRTDVHLYWKFSLYFVVERINKSITCWRLRHSNSGWVEDNLMLHISQNRKGSPSWGGERGCCLCDLYRISTYTKYSKRRRKIRRLSGIVNGYRGNKSAMAVAAEK